MAHFGSVAELSAAEGHVETSDWITIDQERINMFADATDDHQWIHVDPERAADGPFGSTIAHGYLSLALLPALASGRFRVDGMVMGVNYGLDRVRFPHPVPVGSRVRARSEIASVEQVDRGVRVKLLVTVEIEGVDKPAAVAESISLYVLE
ncbi:MULTISPECIES: MaoC family dehydratase [unclassified Arthrobacter]|uniref:MaoC family dehydratase n=1 Tax=unclassified Arthrobacter TaxID=235627 RepID=UPI001D15D896|nr:MaoC family dehydratase [Arthrobacter sp. zg-Y1143]MCC3277656.1 MaoC family dehydratase [Arthrobacter sp. zg-Y40]MCC9176061.1 MaoC family dehydratase [Arthrobacter sp. zg-Y750]MDK1327248.1 MaoC family dehydratase [Arthrobacter sp. zg-Y1143]